jgi:hypothetical protein
MFLSLVTLQFNWRYLFWIAVFQLYVEISKTTQIKLNILLYELIGLIILILLIIFLAEPNWPGMNITQSFYDYGGYEFIGELDIDQIPYSKGIKDIPIRILITCISILWLLNIIFYAEKINIGIYLVELLLQPLGGILSLIVFLLILKKYRNNFQKRLI